MTTDNQQSELEAAGFVETRSLAELVEWVDSALAQSMGGAQDMVPRLVDAARAAGRAEGDSLAAVVQGMKHYLMFGRAHADFLQKEILLKFGAVDFQEMAFLAYERADVMLPASAGEAPRTLLPSKATDTDGAQA